MSQPSESLKKPIATAIGRKSILKKKNQRADVQRLSFKYKGDLLDTLPDCQKIIDTWKTDDIYQKEKIEMLTLKTNESAGCCTRLLRVFDLCGSFLSYNYPDLVEQKNYDSDDEDELDTPDSSCRALCCCFKVIIVLAIAFAAFVFVLRDSYGLLGQRRSVDYLEARRDGFEFIMSN